MNIVAGTEKQTILNSFLSEYNFGKIQYMFNLYESGIIAESMSKEFSPEMKFTFTPWKFDGTEVEPKSGNVLFIGKGFEGRPLLGIMQSKSTTEKARAVFSYSACISQAIKEKIELPANGAGGILYGETKDKIRLLFLPQGVFDFAAQNAPNVECQKMQGVWQDQTFLSKNKTDANNARALSFTRGVLIYSALSGEFPFPKENLEERQADILDSNYLPLKNKVNGVNEILADAVSFDLERSSTATNKDQIKNTSDDSARNFCLAELAAELGLEKNGGVKNIERKSTLSDEEFKAQAKKILDKKNTRATTSRTLRRNTAQFITGVILLIGILITRHYIHKDNLSKPTTISLTAREAAEVFFSGMHNLDTQRMQYSSTGKTAKRIIDSTSNIYVSSKMRSAYSLGDGTLTPERWLYKIELKDYWQFGLTNFMLGENTDSLTPADNRKIAPQRKEKPAPLNETHNAKKTFAVNFCRVHSEGPASQITADKVFGNIEMTFIKDRWLLTDANLFEEESEIFSLEEFEADREAALEQCEGDAVLAADILRKKYYWIPTGTAMHNARIEDETIAAKRARGEVY